MQSGTTKLTTAEPSDFGRITDRSLDDLRACVGVRETYARPWNSSVSSDAVWHFAAGMGDDNPLWWDEAYASSSAVGRMFAPPTFLYSLTNDFASPTGETSKSDTDWLPGCPGMWLGDAWTWHRRAWVGEALVASRELVHVRERTGDFQGRSIAQTELFTFETPTGESVAEVRRTVLRFDADAMAAREAPAQIPEARYDEAERAAIIAQYAGEAAARRGAEPRYWEDVEPGDALPVLVKGPLTLTGMIGWMMGWGANQTVTNRMLFSWLERFPAGGLLNTETNVDDTFMGAHWDPYHARNIGMPRPFDFGAMRISFAAHVLTDWMGDAGALRTLDASVKASHFLGDTTWFTATVTDKEWTDGVPVVHCEVTGRNQRGEVNTTATATVELPTRTP